MNQPVSRDNHPVWTVYNKLRSAKINVRYYGRRLQLAGWVNKSIEVLLAVTAPSSAITGFWLWNTEYGKYVWQCIAILAALAAVAKPVLGLNKRIKDYESLLSGYRMLAYDLGEIRTSIVEKQKYDQALQSEFKKVIKREKVLVAKNPESRECRRLMLRSEVEVALELKSDPFFVPMN